MKRIIPAVVSLFFCLSALAQTPKSFTTDPLRFANEVENYFREAKTEEGKDVARKFSEVWGVKSFNNEQETKIIEFANKMAAKKVKVPEFQDYFASLNNYIKGKHSEQNFNKFFESLEKLLPGKARDFATYLEFTKELFNDNSIFQSKANRWYLQDNNFTLDYDTVPKLIANNTTLYVVGRGDRSAIYNTSGICFPLRKTWVGRNGMVNWSRVLMDTTQVYAELKKYVVNISLAEYTADSVTFYHKGIFKEPLHGVFKEKLTSNNEPDNATYPKFDSYKKNFFIKNLFKSLDYSGGFAMSGGKLLGTGDKDLKANIIIYSGDTLTMRAYSKAFVIYPDRILSNEMEVSIYMGKDSIYHPAAEFKYVSDERKVTLLRQASGIGNTSFFDSYHQMSIEVEAIYWNIDEPTLELAMILGKVKREAFFESKNYYREFKYRKVQGILDYSPLVKLKNIVTRTKKTTFPANLYAQEVGLSETDVIIQLRSLVEQGFILFNEDKNLITVKEKALNYVSNNAGNLDYDILKLTSLTDSNNSATLNIKNFDLEVRGVDQIYLSDSQSVYIVPQDRKIKIKGNRNMQFAGRVHAGTLDFYGKGFTFDYENFKIALLNIDSLTIKVLGKADDRGRRELINVETVLQNINGDLYIDDKNNKSGLKDFPQYPLFDSQKESFVYYDYPYIQKGLYTRDRFYFRVVPFKIDSLDNLSSTSGLAFPGFFYSGDIFPVFEETLLLQPDTSLGFVTRTPEIGYPAYKGKGQFFNTIRLSEKGLFGTGKLDYLTSTTYSDNFLFLLDSMNAPVKTFDIRKGAYKKTTYPLVNSTESHMHWVPYNDSMYVYKKQVPITMYEGKVINEGNLVYSPQNLSGNGKVNFEGANIRSGYFLFNQDDFKADTSAIQIAAVDTAKVALSSSNVQSKVDFIKRQANFKSNTSGASITFPNNQYVTSLNEFTWYFDLKSIDFKASKGSEFSDSYFLSIHPKQDSLQFYAEKARYDLIKSNIEIKGVPSIFVADAEIFPDSNYVEIFPEAKMKTLQKARVIANTESKYHELYNGSINVLGKKRYTGTATYDYKNKSGLIQQVEFTSIDIDTAFQTVASGSLSDTLNFTLNPKILYKGDVFLKANDRYLSYKGFAKIEQNSKYIKSDYFSFAGLVNPDSTLTEIIDPRNQAKERLFIGMHIANSTANAYSTFVSKKVEPNDHNIFAINGLLIYDETTGEFRMGVKDKLFGEGMVGEYLSFNDVSEKVYAEGKFDLGVDYGENLKMAVAGSATNTLIDNKMSFDVLMALDFNFLDKAISIVQDNINKNAFEAQPTRDDRPAFMKGVGELLPDKVARKVIEDIRLYGTYKVPKQLEHTFLFSDLQLEWDQASKSYKSQGETIGIGLIGEKQINKRLKGHLQVVRKRGDDIINFYFENTPNDWYFFSFRGGIMEAISSDQSFNEILTAKSKPDTPYTISTTKRKVDFLRLFQK